MVDNNCVTLFCKLQYDVAILSTTRREAERIIYRTIMLYRITIYNMDTREGCRPSTLRVGALHDRRHYTAITIHTVYQSICPFHCDIPSSYNTVASRNILFATHPTQNKTYYGSNRKRNSSGKYSVDRDEGALLYHWVCDKENESCILKQLINANKVFNCCCHSSNLCGTITVCNTVCCTEAYNQ